MTPAILSFRSASSGEQIFTIDNYPNVFNFIRMLNQNLKKKRLNSFRFFLILNSKDEVDSSLTTGSFDGEGELILFEENFFPNIAEIKIM